MFNGMPEITPGAQITKNQMPGQKNPANQHGPQHGNLSATQDPDQNIREEHSIADVLEPYLSHTNPRGL